LAGRPDWSQAFDDPIPLPHREPLTTLRQAGEYIAALPAKDQRQARWQTAAEITPHGRRRPRPACPYARIAMLRALHHGAPPRAPEPRPRSAGR
jgi:hypothetical protein